MDINININSSKIKINFILIAILILAVVLRFYHLGFQGAWIDEIHTLKEADPDLTFKQFYEIINWREGIPHFYFLIVRFFGEIFGHSLYSIRLVSVVCGVLSVYIMYLLGKSISNKQTGYIAAFLLAIHPFHIEQSQEGRSYAMLIMFVILAFYRLSVFLKHYNLKNAIFLGVACGLITNAQPIGIVSVISVFLIIVINFLISIDKKERINYIKYTVVSGVFTLIVFYPVYQIVEKVSNLSSFWVQKPTYDYVIFVLNQVIGGNNLVLIIFLLAIVSLLIIAIRSIYKNRNLKQNNNLQQFIIVFVWIGFYFTFILIRSLGPSSLMLSRYLSPILPGFIIAIALVLSISKNKIINSVATLLFGALLLQSLFIQKDYYETPVKSEFNKITRDITNNNKSNEVVISNWGWLLSYFLDKDSKLNNVYEKNLDVYANDVKTNSVLQENFWYVDGNSRPYSVAPETQKFLDDNYILDKSIDYYDCWAKHYVSKKILSSTDKFLKLNQFSNAKFDGSGNLMFFENSKSSSSSITLEKGNYSLEISCLSFPIPKINNENAKFIVFINDKNYGSFEANEKATETIKIEFNQPITSNFQMDIIFTNDFSKDKLDRNLQISKIELKRK